MLKKWGLYMLVLTRRVGEKLLIGDDTEIIILGVKGNQVRLGIKAPEDIVILREEVAPHAKKNDKDIR